MLKILSLIATAILLSTSGVHADICDSKIAEFGFDYIKIKTDSRLQTAYRSFACKQTWQTTQEASQDGFSIDILDWVGIDSNNFSSSYRTWKEQNCHGEDNQLSRSDALEIIKRTLNGEAAKIVDMCVNRSGFFCDRTPFVGKTATIVCDWKPAPGRLIAPKYVATLTHAKFAVNASDSPWKSVGDLKVGNNSFLIERDGDETEVGFFLDIDLLESQTVTIPPIPSYAITAVITKDVLAQDVIAQESDFASEPVGCTSGTSYSKRFKPPTGFIGLSGTATNVITTCGSSVEPKLKVDNPDLVVSGALNGCPLTPVCHNEPVCDPRPGELSLGASTLRKAQEQSTAVTLAEHITPQTCRQKQVCDGAVCKDNGRVSGDVELLWARTKLVQGSSQSFSKNVGVGGGAEFNPTSDGQAGRYRFTATITNLRSKDDRDATQDPNGSASRITLSSAVNEPRDVVSLGSQDARAVFTASTGNLLISVPGAFTRNYATPQTLTTLRALTKKDAR